MTKLTTRMVSGFVSAGLVLGVAELVSVPIAASSSPLTAVGSVVVDHTPDALREWVIKTVGTNDKHLLFITLGIAAVVIACLAGVLERSRRPIGSVLFVGFAIVGILAAWSRPGANWTHVLPTVLGAIAGLMALRTLTRRIEDTERGLPSDHVTEATVAATPEAAPVSADESQIEAGTSPPEPKSAVATTDMGRRTVMRSIATVGALALVSGVAGRLWGAKARDVSANREAVRLPTPAGQPAPEIPAGADMRLPGLTPYMTSNADFYRIDTALSVPQVSTTDWSLRIHGMVDREITLSYADLAARPAVERLITLCCVSNPVNGPLIGNARWLGYRIADLLAEAKPHPDADMVLSRSIDGFTAGTPLSVLTDGRDAMLAVGMNGDPLPIEHGYPVRMVVPGLYGYVSATKWVVDLEVTRFDKAEAYWTKRGWSARGPIKTECRIDTPRGGSHPTSGRVAIAGVAWAQHRGIKAVEVQIDNGPWQPARLADEPTIDSWRQWVYGWDATPGKHTLRARATDGTGTVQTSEDQDVVPDGASGYPSVEVTV